VYIYIDPSLIVVKEKQMLFSILGQESTLVNFEQI